MKYCAVTLDMMMGLAVLTQLMLAVLDSMAVPATEAEARMVSIPVAVPVAAKVAVPVASVMEEPVLGFTPVTVKLTVAATTGLPVMSFNFAVSCCTELMTRGPEDAGDRAKAGPLPAAFTVTVTYYDSMMLSVAVNVMQ